MKSRTSLICLAVLLGGSSCTSNSIEVRSIKQPLAEGSQPTNFRVAEGNAQLVLGNVALAAEAYRKALREQPDSVPAMIGLATCYDRMGRGDLSRRQFEMALAVDPAKTEIYSLFAQSLEAQGQRDEAARVKTELAARVVAPEAPREVPGSVPVLPPPPAQSVTVALAPPRSAPVAVERPIAANAPAAPIVATAERPKLMGPPALAPASNGQGVMLLAKPSAPSATPGPVAVVPGPLARLSIERPAGTGMRLERVSLREVALVTRPEPKWEARTITRTATSTTIQFERRPQSQVTLLNAARVQGLAARTRAYLAMRGFAGVEIGDAPAVRKQSAILYNSAEAVRAHRLAAQFGFELERREGARGGLTILLGRDAAREAALKPRA